MSGIPFNIFPVGADKAPLVAGWQDKATRDGHTISQWEAHGAVAWGIPCGAANGLFVIDLDVDKATGEPMGEASLKALPRYAGLLDHANVHTPSGGRHIYCQHFDEGRNTTSKIGPKIDTRGQGGYVVAPGSIVEGGSYLGHFPEMLPRRPHPAGSDGMMQSADPTRLHRARKLTRQAAQWLHLLLFQSRPGATTFSVSMCHYHAMLDPEASDADRLAACRAMEPAVQRRRLAEEFVAEAEQAHKMQLDPYHLHWKTTPRGAALWAIANLLDDAIAAFEAEQVDA